MTRRNDTNRCGVEVDINDLDSNDWEELFDICGDRRRTSEGVRYEYAQSTRYNRPESRRW